MMFSLRRKIGLFLSSLPLLVAAASAQTITAVAAGTSATMTGSLGLFIDLGIENVPGVTTAQAKFYYNIVSIALVMWLAWVADEPSSAQFCVIGVGISAFTAWMGWFTTPNPGGEWGLIVMCALLAGLLYMTEKKRLLYGVNGAGDPLVQIVVFLLIIQSTIGLINGAGIFTTGTTVATPSNCVNGSVTYTSCTINGNVALANIQTNTGTKNILDQGFDILLTIATTGWNLLVMVLQLLVSVACFSYVLYSTFPWILDSPQAILLIGIMQVIIWIIYTLSIFRYIFKPMPQDVR